MNNTHWLGALVVTLLCITTLSAIGLATMPTPFMFESYCGFFISMLAPVFLVSFSELYFPLAGFPWGFRLMAQLNPLTYTVRGLRYFTGLELPGTEPLEFLSWSNALGLSEGWACAAVMAVMTIIGAPTAVWLYHWMLKRAIALSRLRNSG